MCCYYFSMGKLMSVLMWMQKHCLQHDQEASKGTETSREKSPLLLLIFNLIIWGEGWDGRTLAPEL